MRILLTNDDGIHAPGLGVLEEIARAPRAATYYLLAQAAEAIGRRGYGMWADPRIAGQ